VSFINVQIQSEPLKTQIINWVGDCTALELAVGDNTPLIHIWDFSTFVYEKQLGRTLPKGVVVISRGEECDENQVLLSGALDFIAGSSSFEVIALRLSLHVQRLQYLNRLESLSVTDALTGLFNRRKFTQELNTCWRQGVRHQLPCSMLMLDVDHFKKFNDTYGHLAGDQCLKELSDVLRKEAVRPHDTVARVGGEEFAIILPDTDAQGAEHVANRIIKSIADLNILNEYTELGIVSISVGLACITPKSGDSIEQWQQEADDALYFAKSSGRNQVKVETSGGITQETLIF
jgi:diguanylate cyclase (GGDEF)-like protein